jgi:signal transduction histidine kinase
VSRLLVVDDDDDLRRTLSDMLEMSGHEVTEAADGPAALRAAADDVFDVILLDVMMPGMSGLEVCSRLRADAAYDEIPILMVTALADVRDRVAGLQAGADDYIGKPFDTAELIARVGAALRQRRLMHALADARRTTSQLNRQLVRAEEELRAEVVADLHDTMLQTLIAARMWLEDVGTDDEVPGRVRTRAGILLEQVDASISTGRRLIRGLRPPNVARGGLPRLIETDIRALVEGSGIDARFDFPDRLDGLAPEVETMLYRIVREGVLNALRHASPHRIDVALRPGEGKVRATVADDGRGFDTDLLELLPDVGHFGVVSMGVRAEAAGGRLHVASVAGRGTRLTVELPLGGERDS